MPRPPRRRHDRVGCTAACRPAARSRGSPHRAWSGGRRRRGPGRRPGWRGRPGGARPTVGDDGLRQGNGARDQGAAHAAGVAVDGGAAVDRRVADHELLPEQGPAVEGGVEAGMAACPAARRTGRRRSPRARTPARPRRASGRTTCGAAQPAASTVGSGVNRSDAPAPTRAVISITGLAPATGQHQRARHRADLQRGARCHVEVEFEVGRRRAGPPPWRPGAPDRGPVCRKRERRRGPHRAGMRSGPPSQRGDDRRPRRSSHAVPRPVPATSGRVVRGGGRGRRCSDGSGRRGVRVSGAGGVRHVSGVRGARTGPGRVTQAATAARRGPA